MNPFLGGHEIYNFSEPFLGQHYYILSLCEPCPRIEKHLFKKDISFKLFTHKLPPLMAGVMKFTICCLFSL